MGDGLLWSRLYLLAHSGGWWWLMVVEEVKVE